MYKLSSVIYQDERTLVYKSESDSGESFILKTASGDFPVPERSSSILREYEIIKKIDSPLIVKAIDYYEENGKPYIVLEPFSGKPIFKILNERELSLQEFLSGAITLAEGVKEIHEAGIIHKDINSDNILWDEKDDKWKIIDFSLATQLTHESMPVISANRIEGNLNFISPEQTGRMNRKIDYRTDYYSLGVLYYKMSTNRFPFSGNDPNEIIHAHIAKQPTPPHIANSQVPKPVSDIIMKLIAKNAEDRYQSVNGLQHDLKTCMEGLLSGTLKEFKLGKKDSAATFYIPETFHGREKEVAALLGMFEKARQGFREALLFSGIAGVGKTVLVNQIQVPAIDNGAYFIQGKYNNQDMHIPYSGFIRGFHQFIGQLMTQSEKELTSIKDHIRNELGTNLKVITNALPILEEITGKPPELTQLPPQESQNRFNVTFQKFLNLFADSDHPLVIFLDDLQWADEASLQLITTLLGNPDLQYCFFIGAYRSDEVFGDHPLLATIERLKDNDTELKNIPLEPLGKNFISEIIFNVLKIEPNDSEDLSLLVHQKTKGNPFFVKEFLKSLYQAGLIRHEKSAEPEGKTGWHWDIEKIKSQDVTENVVSFMAEGVKHLPEKAIETMKVICCNRKQFSLVLLSRMLSKSTQQILEDVKDAVSQGMLIVENSAIGFSHDRIREATYSLLSEEDKQEIHFQIGKAFFIASGEKKNG